MRKSFVKAREHWPPYGLVNFPKALLLMATSDPLWNAKKTPLTQTYPFLTPTQPSQLRPVMNHWQEVFSDQEEEATQVTVEEVTPRQTREHQSAICVRAPHLLARCVHRKETVPPGTCVACSGVYRKAYHHNNADRVSIQCSDHLPPLQRDWTYKNPVP